MYCHCMQQIGSFFYISFNLYLFQWTQQLLEIIDKPIFNSDYYSTSEVFVLAVMFEG